MLPTDPYVVNGPRFGERCTYDGTYWGVHLGEDANMPAGTSVRAIGRGRVVYSAFHPGTKDKGNWGNIIVIAHKHPKTKKNFFSLYAHLGRRLKERGERIECGDIIGVVGRGYSPANGWWEEHLHFSIYGGPWKGKVLPGYWKPGQHRTMKSYWESPSVFVRKFMS